MFTSFTLILSISAFFSYINHKFLKLPTTIGLMLLAIVTALLFLSRLKAVTLLTWGGLRGGISVALALSLSEDIVAKDAIVFITYTVVIFSILVQGLTIGKLTQRLYA